MSELSDELSNAASNPVEPGLYDARMTDIDEKGRGKAELIGGEHDGKQVDFDALNLADLPRNLTPAEQEHVLKHHSEGYLHKPQREEHRRRYW